MAVTATPGASPTASAHVGAEQRATNRHRPRRSRWLPGRCPSELPTKLASVDDPADPACYGSTALTIDGWLAEQTAFVSIPRPPSWTMSISGLFPEPPTVRDGCSTS